MAERADACPGYRIGRLIGRGARSRVFEGTELATGRAVAVKHNARRTPDDDPFLAQVEREYEASRSASHRHLRQSFHLHRVKKWFRVTDLYLVMELVEGRTLEESCPDRLLTLLTVFRKVAEGLIALHAAGWIHADIKPINIMVAPKGVVKVIDFGQSCPIGYKKTRIQGTPDYIAPEQVRRMPLDERTDVFNLGATMYWALTKTNYPTALRAENTSNRQAIVTLKPVAPIEVDAKIPLSLSTLVMECCRENPMDRPANMTQVDLRLAAVQQRWRERHANPAIDDSGSDSVAGLRESSGEPE